MLSTSNPRDVPGTIANFADWKAAIERDGVLEHDNTSSRARSGRRSATSNATIAPSLQPATWADPPTWAPDILGLSAMPVRGSAMIVVVGRVRTDAERRAMLIEVGQRVAIASRREAGCISYALHQDTEDENAFVFVEELEDETALRQHFATAHIAEFMSESRT
jgi:quinol monooxygenase YgiN